MSLLWAAASADAGVDGREIGARAGRLRAGSSTEIDPEISRHLQLAEVVGGGDQRLARDAVGEHGGPAEPVAVDERDLGTQVGGNERRFITTRAAPDDDDSIAPLHPSASRLVCVCSGQGSSRGAGG